MPQAATAGIAGKPHETGGLIRVLFDSFWQPAPAGTRSAAMNVREIICRVEPYQIDFQVEAQPELNRLVVTGQLLDISQPELVGPGVEVTLSNLRGIDVRTATNQFGEFRGELENSGDLELSFLPRSGKPIFILVRGAREPSLETRP
jgi:hypothetical protein